MMAVSGLIWQRFNSNSSIEDKDKLFDGNNRLKGHLDKQKKFSIQFCGLKLLVLSTVSACNPLKVEAPISWLVHIA